MPFPPELTTVAESSQFTATSRHADVLRFLEALAKAADPRRCSLQSMGKSADGQEMAVLVLSAAGRLAPAAAHARGAAGEPPPPVVMVLANIHAGEVEGKESLLAIARDALLSERPDAPPSLARLIERATLVLVPDYNCDGNDAIDPANRRLDLRALEGQIGPESGVGTRNTTRGFNLNRDYIKLDAPESRHLMRLWHSWRPHLTIDCHTTNGSIHGYHLTYDTAHLVPSSPAAPLLFARDVLLPELSKRLEARTGHRTFFYGNFRDHDDPSKGWETYPGQPRFGSHWRGLAGRMDVLLECYSYLDYPTRCAVMRETLVELLSLANDRGAEIVRVVESAEEETIARGRAPAPGDWLGVSYSEIERRADGSAAVSFPIHAHPGRVGIWAWDAESQKQRRVPGRELVRWETTHFARFVPTKLVRRPWGYLVPAREERVAKQLRMQGIALVPATTVPGELVVEEFRVASRLTTKSRDIADLAPAETILLGHHERRRVVAGAGDWLVPMAQPLANLALYLLEAESDDGLARWGFFDHVAEGATFPIARIVELPAAGR